MGLLDSLFNLNPEQNQGLLAASAKMLEMSGPSRVPHSLGQIVGTAYGTYNNAMSEAEQRAEMKRQREMQSQLLEWKIKDAESDFGHQQGVRARDSRIADRVRSLYEGGQGAGQGMPEGSAPGAASGFSGNLSATPAFTPDPRLGLGGAMGGVGDIQSLLGSFNTRPPSAAPGGSTSYAQGGAPGIPRSASSGKPSAGPQGAEWFSMGLPPEFAMSMMQGGRGKPNRTQQHVERLMGEAEIYASEGDFENADKRYKSAAGLMPQVDRIDIATDPNTQQPVRVITYKDGREELSAFGAKRDMVDIDLGGKRKFVDRNQVRVGEEYVKTQSPDSAAADARFASRRMGGGTSGGGSDASLDDETLDMMADQALRGDSSVFRNIGRGGQGSANLVKLRSRITQKAKAQNLTGADLAAISADYAGLATGMRVSANIGARVENAISEARELAPLAVTAGREVARSGMLPFGKAQVMFDTQTNDPALKKFAAANVGFVQAYAGAMARGQKPTVHDKEHAEKLISEATSQPAYEAVMGQLMLEMDAASKAPQNVREHLRNEIGGRGNEHGGGKGGGSPAAKPVITLNDIAATARSSGRSTREVTAAFRAKGFKIQGDK